MKIKIGFIIDPIENFKPHKDTSFAMMLEAQRRGWEIYIAEQQDLFLKQSCVFATLHQVSVLDKATDFYQVLKKNVQPLNSLDIVLMRKDPPFNMNYIYTTYLLELAQQQGLLVVNNPQSLRDANEKLFTAHFPQCCPTTLVSAQKSHLLSFLQEEKDIVIKPLDGMGGQSIFHLTQHSKQVEAIFDELTAHESRPIMAQRFIPEIKAGDKRVLVINGEPVPYALARIPHKDDFRGNLAQGATGEGRELSTRDRWIVSQVGPTLRDKGLLFAGLDIIGDYLTEINVTSPTCVRELDSLFNLNICNDFFTVLEATLTDGFAA